MTLTHILIGFIALGPAAIHYLSGRKIEGALSLFSFGVMAHNLPLGIALWLFTFVTSVIKP